MSDNTIEEINSWLTKAQDNFLRELTIRESISDRLGENYRMREFIIYRLLCEVVSLLVQNKIDALSVNLLYEECGINSEDFKLPSNNNPLYDSNRVTCVYIKSFIGYAELWYSDIEGSDGAVKDLPFCCIRAIATGLVKYLNNQQ
jgi:hypothetical protein